MAENRQSTFELTKSTDLNIRQPSDENILKSGGVDNQKASRPSSVHKGDTLHWFAYVGPDQKEVRSESTEDREQRLKILRDKQNEERQRKLEELKAQALAAQRFRELKEEERRRRIEDLRVRETDRRQQVGERKRIIYEAERDRRESILKKNMEREARFELKKRNERSSNFAFGSSTPRMLEPGDTVGSFWGHRRATSTNNIVFSAVPLTRRSSERDLDGSKKRATSAGGLDRNITEGNGETMPAGCASGHVGRRRTDLMPTIPTRDTACASLRKAFTKSPGRAYSMSRLDQLAKPRKRVPADLPSVQESDTPKSHSQPSPSNKSMSRSMGHLAVSRLAVPAPQRPLRKSDSKSMHQLCVAPPLPPPRTTRAILLRKRAMELPAGPSRPGSSLSQQSTTSVASSINMRQKPAAAPRKPRPISIAETGVTNEQNKNIAMSDAKKPDVSKPPLPKTRKSSLVKVSEKTPTKSMKVSPKVSVKTTPLQSPCSDAPMSVVEIQPAQPQQSIEIKPIDIEESKQPFSPVQQVQAEPVIEPVPEPTANISLTKDEPEKPSETITEQLPNSSIEEPNLDMVDMTASMIAKVRITTEEEAKAALAEKRRRAREEAERAAEAERLRVEEETRLEQERQRKEEEQLRKLAEDQRRAEEERLAQAIKEAQKREEEERLKREEEQKLKLEKEEQERKAREETEKQRLEMQERLKQEEIEREARRKRVEAIMLRTRAKNNGTNQNKDEGANEKNIEEMKSSEINNKSTIELYEKTAMEKEAILFNGAFKNQTVNSQENGDSHKEPQHNNGHRNGVEISDNFSKVDNSLIQHVTNTLLDISELDPFKNANSSLDLSTDKINNEDNINSNNPTESCGTTDLLL